MSRATRAPDLTQYDGLLTVTLRGTPYERGRQHGELLGDRVRHLRQRLIRDIVFGKGWAMGSAFLSVLYGILARMHPNVPREMREEMRGLADGARVPYRDILLINCFDDVLHALIQLNPVLAPALHHRFVKPVLGWLGAPPTPAPGFACSCFALTADRTDTGGPLHGRNLDYLIGDGFVDPEGLVPQELRANLIVFLVQPARGRAFASVAWPGFVGAVTILNDAGLSLACLTSTVARETANGMPLLFLYRLIGQYATSLDEAEWLVRGTRRTIGNNLLLVSSPANDARAVELTMGRVAAAPPENGLIAMTNHFQQPSMLELQTGWVVPNSEHRLTRLREMFAEGTVSVQEAQAALGDLCPPAGADNVWDCIQNPGTIYSSLAEPLHSRLWVRAFDRPDRTWVALDLTEIFSSGHAEA